MLKRFLLRAMISLCFAIPIGIVFAPVGWARPDVQDVEQGECQDCHEIIRSHWGESAHANAIDDPVFQEAWQAQGKPNDCLSCHTTGYDQETGSWEADGVTCSVCHSPVPSNHPDQIMPTDISSRLCGTCHLDTHQEWSDSVHAQEDMSCVSCHSSHTTSLKASGNQELCQVCHSEEVHFYEFTAHYKEGLLCTDCHLSVSETQMGEGHGKRHHTFTVDTQSCGQCHGEEMHYPVVKSPTAGGQDQMVAVEQAGVGVLIEESATDSQPGPVSPIGFAVLAALLGTAFGMILAPWSERWYRRINSTERGK
jgi:hypothetical protein